MKYYTENITVFNLKGNDSKDFLQRLSTNDLRYIETKKSDRTIFLNEKGRIIDFVSILKPNDDILILVTNGNEIKLRLHLEKYIVMDDVSISVEQAKKLTFVLESKHEFNEIKDLNIIEGNYYFPDLYSFRKVIAILKNEDSVYLKNKKNESESLTEDSFMNFAIDNTYMYTVNELNENINPLECYLKEYISFNKGCYIGQEVIARLDSQNKIPKLLVNISSEFRIKKNDKIFSMTSGIEKESGFITSTVYFNNKYKGFAFIRENYLNNESNYYINKDVNKSISINKLN